MSRDNERLTCGNCRFYDEDEAGNGMCRRYAPHPVPEAFVIGEREDFNPRFVFPVVDIDDWCGELVEIEGESQ